MPVTKPQSLKQTTAFEENDVLASICKDSFYEFVKEFWGEIIAEKPSWNWHIKYLCDELQKMAERVFLGLPREYDLVINIPPGTTKSTICSVMFPAWTWIRMPSTRIIGASHKEGLQTDLAQFCRNVVRSDKYKTCFPNVQIRKEQDAKSYFMNTAGGRRLGIGVGGIAGFHAHFILIDDPIDPKEVTDTKVHAANFWMTNSLLLRKVDKEITPTILIMQRVCQNDCSNEMLNRKNVNVKHICLPAVLSEDVNPPEIRKYYVDGLLDPVRLSRKALRELEPLEWLYKAQIMQKPIPLGGEMFHVERIGIDTAPNKWKKKVRFWDKAGTKDGGAYTVGVLMGEDVKDQFWILDVVRGQWDSAQREDIIKHTALLDGKSILVGVEQEPGSGGKESAQNTIRNLSGFSVFAERPTGDKAQRATPFSAQVNGNNVFLVKADWNEEYTRELRTFSPENSKCKDQVDASSGAFTKLTGGGTLEIGVFKLFD